MSNENKIDYLENIQVHQFPEDMSIYESALETCLLAEANWAYILESTITGEYKAYEYAILNGQDKETAITEADDSSKEGFFNKCIEFMKKVGSYIAGMFSKFIVAMGNLFKNNSFLTSDEAKKRIEKGLKYINSGEVYADERKFKGFILNPSGLDTLLSHFSEVDKLVKELGDLSKFKKSSNVKNADETLDKKYGDKKIREIIAGKAKSDDKNAFKDAIVEQLSNSDKKDNEYIINEEVYKRCFDNFINTKNYTAKAKQFYEISKSTINTAIANIETLKKLSSNEGEFSDSFIKSVLSTLNSTARILAQTNGIVLTLIKEDYASCCRILLKLYNMGKKDVKEESKEPEKKDTKAAKAKSNAKPVNASAIFKDESIESIFGTTAFV